MAPMSPHETTDDVRELARVIEALVFVADKPVEAQEIGRVFAEVTDKACPSSETIRKIVDQINVAYQREGRVMRIQCWAGGFRMTTTSAVAPYIKSFLRQDYRHKLTRSLIETLAIVCYKQPTTKPEVDEVRGVSSNYALRKLLDMGFIRILGHSESVGRPLLYGTTDFFLEEFALSNLDQLPNLREIEELLEDETFDQTQAGLLLRKHGKSPPSGDT